MRGQNVLIPALIAAVIIGCGGSGGGGAAATGLTSSTATTATTSTTATTATTSTTSTTSSTSGGPGVLPKNRIVYAEQQTDGTSQVRHIGPSGETDTLALTLDANTSAYALNPVVSNQVFFAAAASAGGSYKLYRNTTPVIAGATAISPGSYSFIDGVQVSNNGDFLIFSGDIGDGSLRLYYVQLKPTLGTPTLLDMGSFFHIAGTNDKVVYSKPDGGDADIYVKPLPSGTAVKLTEDAAEDVYPQWSKDNSKIIFSSNRGASLLDLYSMNADGTGQTRLTDTADDSEFGGSFNSAIDAFAYGVSSNDPANSGLYRITGTTARVQLKATNGILGTYWTSTDGKLNQRFLKPLSPANARLQKLLNPGKKDPPADVKAPTDKVIDPKVSDKSGDQ